MVLQRDETSTLLSQHKVQQNNNIQAAYNTLFAGNPTLVSNPNSSESISVFDRERLLSVLVDIPSGSRRVGGLVHVRSNKLIHLNLIKFLEDLNRAILNLKNSSIYQQYIALKNNLYQVNLTIEKRIPIAISIQLHHLFLERNTLVLKIGLLFLPTDFLAGIENKSVFIKSTAPLLGRYILSLNLE